MQRFALAGGSKGKRASFIFRNRERGKEARDFARVRVEKRERKESASSSPSPCDSTLLPYSMRWMTKVYKIGKISFFFTTNRIKYSMLLFLFHT